MHDVFISYSRKDYVDENKNPIPGNVIDKLIKLFEESKIDYWIDKKGIYSSQDFIDKICEAIDQAYIVVFVSSENSHKSKWTSRELNYADKNSHPIISLELGNVPTKGSIALLLSNYDNIVINDIGEDKAFARLIESINKILDDANPNRKVIRELKESQETLYKAMKQKEAEWKAVVGKLAGLGEIVEIENTGNDEQVELLRAALASKEKEILSLQDSLNAVKSELSDKTEQLESLQATLEECKAKLSERELKELEHKPKIEESHRWDSAYGEITSIRLFGHSSRVNCVAFSPDGRQIVSASADGTLRRWDAFTGGEIGSPMIGHTSWVDSVAYSPNGKLIISASSDKTLRIWDAKSGKQIGHPIECYKELCSVAYSPNGKQIASGYGYERHYNLQLWSAKTRKEIDVRFYNYDAINSICFSPDGKRLVTACDDGEVRLWDVATGGQFGVSLCGHTSNVLSAVFSYNGKRIVSASRDESLIQWDSINGEQIGPTLRGHTSWVNSAAYSPDGALIVSGSRDKTLRIWDADTGKQIGIPLEGHLDSVNSVAFSPDGKQIVSASSDGTLRIWEWKPFGQPRVEHNDNPVPTVNTNTSGWHESIIAEISSKWAKILGGFDYMDKESEEEDDEDFDD